MALCRKPFGSSESGSLRISFDVVRGETESMAKAHGAIASQMKRELEEPLAAFAGGLKERRKIVQNGIERLLKSKVQQTQAVNKVFILFVPFVPLLTRLGRVQIAKTQADPGQV